MSHSTTGKTPLPHPLPSPEELGPLVGAHVGGYEVSGYVGEGPTGVVYRCEDATGAPLAMKVMHRELSPERAQSLAVELSKLATVESRHVARVIDTGLAVADAGSGEQLYCVGELLQGMDLAERIARGAIAATEAARIVIEVCRGVEAAHALGVVHGGLKPRNVFLVQRPVAREWDHVEVLDFGASRSAGKERGVIVGNPHYMAPEQFGGHADARTDVYALGLILHELFAGSPPFAGSHGKVMLQQLREPPPPLRDPELSRLVARALAKSPEERFSTVTRLREALEAWSAGAALSEAASFHVIHRTDDAAPASELAVEDHSWANSPETTVPMQKIDITQLAETTKRPGSIPPPSPQANGANGSNGAATDSVEASLEDFISQANKSFQEPADGWTLNTDEVELVTEADLAPVQPAKIAAAVKGSPTIQNIQTLPAAEPAAPVAAKAQRSTKQGIPIITPSSPPPAAAPVVTATPVAAPVAELTVEEAAITSDSAMPFAAPAAAGGMAVAVERTEVVAAPLPPVASAPIAAAAAAPTVGPVVGGTSPAMLFGVILAAFLIGGGMVFAVLRYLTPSQPVIVPQMVTVPAPLVTPPAPTAIAPTAAPVVTPAHAPVVTPLPSTPPAPAAVTGPVVTQLPTVTPAPAPVVTPSSAPEAKRHHVVAAKPAAAPRADRPAPVAHANPAPVAHEKPAREKPAAVAAPVKEKPAKPVAEKKADKGEKKGADWVDPF